MHFYSLKFPCLVCAFAFTVFPFSGCTRHAKDEAHEQFIADEKSNQQLDEAAAALKANGEKARADEERKAKEAEARERASFQAMQAKLAAENEDRELRRNNVEAVNSVILSLRNASIYHRLLPTTYEDMVRFLRTSGDNYISAEVANHLAKHREGYVFDASALEFRTREKQAELDDRAQRDREAQARAAALDAETTALLNNPPKSSAPVPPK